MIKRFGGNEICEDVPPRCSYLDQTLEEKVAQGSYLAMTWKTYINQKGTSLDRNNVIGEDNRRKSNQKVQ